MSLSAFKLKKLTAAIGTCLVLGASGPMLADTNLEVVNDGLMLSAFVDGSSDVVLSMSVRIIGPDGFALEKRVEDSVIDWIPEGDLVDGIYHWEAWTVTASPSAQPREFMFDRAMPQPDVADQGGTRIQSDQAAEISQDDVPVERFFRSQDKQVIRESGSFRVNNGWLEELKENPDDSLSRHAEPSGVQRLVGALLDRLIPTAHAETFDTNVVIEKSFPFLEYRDTDAASVNSGRAFIAYFDELMRFQIRYGQAGTFPTIIPLLTTPIAIERGAASSSIFIRGGGSNPSAFGSGFIGMGTNTPTQALHISRANPQIRLEDTGESQSWFIRNQNAGRFEIADVSGANNQFTIEPGAPDLALYIRSNGNVGIGTSVPQRRLEVSSDSGCQIRLRQNNELIQLCQFDDRFEIQPQGGRGTFRIDNPAPRHSLVIGGSGDVGLGTESPDAALHVRRTDNSAEIRVEDTGTSDQIQFRVINEGPARFRMENNAAGGSTWTFSNFSSGFAINRAGTGTTEMLLRNNGDLQIRGTLTELSSRSVKHGILPVDGATVLGKLSKLNISEWRYDNTPKARHIGPMAEDWHDLFGLGSSNKRISPRDLAGVSLAAAQALYTQNNIKQERIDQLATRNQELESRLERLEAIILLSDIELAGKP